MTQTLIERYNLNLILTVLFIAGIGMSLYYVYSLPVALRLANGYQPEFIKVYLALGSTFILGAATLILALGYRKEVVVFREKIVDKEDLRKEAAEQAGKTTISLEVVKEGMSSPQLKDALTAGIIAVCKQLEAGQGALYLAAEEEGKRIVELHTGYALNKGESTTVKYEFGEGLVGQVATSKNTLYVDEVPQGYITILSGLGSSSPRYLAIAPLKANDRLIGVVEIATFHKLTEDERKFVEESGQLMTDRILAKG